MRNLLHLKESDSRISGNSISFIDIDETTFHTYAKVGVMKNGKKVGELDNQQFNTYQLKDGEYFNFDEFQSSDVFHKTSTPINEMIRKIQKMIDCIKLHGKVEKVIFLTARSDFDNKELFLKTFRENGIDVDIPNVYIERSGNLRHIPNVADRKKEVILKYLKSGEFTAVRMYDDDNKNLQTFMELGQEINNGKYGILKIIQKKYPRVRKVHFFPLKVLENGKVRKVSLRESVLMERILPELPQPTYDWVLDITSENHKTPNAYTKWLGQLIVDGKLKNPIQDNPMYLHHYYDAITLHKKFKQANVVKPIMDYTSWEEFEQDLENVLNKQNYKSNSELDKIAKNGAKTIYDDGETKVLHITNLEAARKYGKGTRWCTSAAFTDKYFKHYTEKDWQQLWYVFKGDKKYGVSVAGESYYSPNISFSIFNEQDYKLASVNGLDANLFGNKKEVKKRFLNQDWKIEEAKLKDFDLFWLIYKLVIKTFFPELYNDVVEKLK